MPQLGSVPNDSTQFLSVAEYRSLLQLANQFHIEVIPEFDMPGRLTTLHHNKSAMQPGSQFLQFKKLDLSKSRYKYINLK